MLKTLKPVPIFSIANTSDIEIRYEVKWLETDNWRPYTLKPHPAPDRWEAHNHALLPSYMGPTENINPRVRFVSNPNDSKIIYHFAALEFYSPNVGPDYELYRRDAREYHFSYDSRQETVQLIDSEKGLPVRIANQ